MTITDPGPRPSFAWIKLDQLVIDARYQRNITREGVTMINRIVRDFSWSKFQPITVTGPDGSGDYPVIDGQHRLEACRRHPDIEEAPCWIVPAERLAAQASSFVAINKNRIAVTKVATFWAQLLASDPQALWVKQICDNAGVQIGKVGTGIQPPKTTIALGTLLTLRPLKEEVITTALRILVEAQPESENLLRGHTIKAMVRLVGTHGAAIDPKRLKNVIADLPLDNEIEKARQLRNAFGGKIETALMALIIKAYNRRLRLEERLPEMGV